MSSKISAVPAKSRFRVRAFTITLCLIPLSASCTDSLMFFPRVSLSHGISVEFSFESYKIPIRFKSDGINSHTRGFFVSGYQKECPNVQFPDASQNRNSYHPFTPYSPPPVIQPPYERKQPPSSHMLPPGTSSQRRGSPETPRSGVPSSGTIAEYPRNHVAKSFLEQIVESQVHVMDSRTSGVQSPHRQVTSASAWSEPSNNPSVSPSSSASSSASTGRGVGDSRVSYSVVSSSNPSLLLPPPPAADTSALTNDDAHIGNSRIAVSAVGSAEYPNNYVAKALLEQVVETQVRVVDNRDGLPPVQFSNRGSRPGIHVNSSYISLA